MCFHLLNIYIRRKALVETMPNIMQKSKQELSQCQFLQRMTMFHPDCKPKVELDCLIKRDLSKSTAYKIEFDDTEGRFLKADRDIDQGELIIEEELLFRTPVKSTLPVCLCCYKLIDWTDCYYCSKCNWPLCSVTCAQENQSEHDPECRIFQGQNVQVDSDKFNYTSFEPLYDIIAVLRVFDNDNKTKMSSFWKLMSHWHKYSQNQDWIERHAHVWNYIRDTLKLDITEEKIKLILAIIEVNGHFGNFNQVNVQLFHPLTSILSHDCFPNVVKYYSDIPNGNKVECRVSKAILKGEKLSISYIDQLTPVTVRQDYLSKEKFFECKCSRCTDRNDRENFEDALICQKCAEAGFLNPPEWKCTKCDKVTLKPEAETILFTANQDAVKLLNNPSLWRVELYEAYLVNYGKILHPENLCLLKIKIKLTKFYGRLSSPQMMGQTLSLLEYVRVSMARKFKLSNDCLVLLNKLQPGLSSLKGMMLYEKYIAIYNGAKLDRNSGAIENAEAKERFQQAMIPLMDSLDHLKYELDGTQEKQLLEEASETVSALKSLIEYM